MSNSQPSLKRENTQYLNFLILGLGTVVLGLQVTAFVIIGLTTSAFMLSICGSRNNEDKEACINVFGACMACLYPLAGIYS